jgi:hypothetical protein
MQPAYLLARLAPQSAGGYAVASFGVYPERWPTDNHKVLYTEICHFEADEYENSAHMCRTWAKASRLNLDEVEP